MKRTAKINPAQEKHDAWLKKQTPESLEILATKAKALLDSKRRDSTQLRSSPQFASFDPIEEAMRHNSGLTREKAREVAEAFGF